MKSPKKLKQWLREIDKVTEASFKQLDQPNQSQREQFEAVLNIVIERIARNRGVEKTKVAEKIEETVEALADYFKRLPEEHKDWAAIVTFLYIKFHQLLGLIDEKQALQILLSQTFA